ncbi:hypothetical protein MferCBS31731_005329 [Microsporum ferrugineum]
MSSSQEHGEFEFLDGWTSDSDGDDGEADFSPDEALLLSDLIASVTDKYAADEDAETETDIDQPSSPVPDIEDHEYLRLALGEASSQPGSFEECPWSETSQRYKKLFPQRNIELSVEKEGENPPQEHHTSSPLERFRRPPKKGLSVSDLVAPSWCEMQFFYSLAEPDRRKRTPAMKRGTVVHRILENEVHASVPVAVVSREDVWALRIWNVIYGLRTLRDTGLTREMEVWGILDGEIVTGVIDLLSLECPDPELRDSIADKTDSGVRSTRRLAKREDSEEYSFCPLDGEGERRSGSVLSSGGGIYLTDVKTRLASGRGLPGVESPSFKPARMQLQLYHHLLSRLIDSDDITIHDIAERYSLKPHAPLSDAFLAQVGSINDDYFDTEACSWTQSQSDDADDAPSSSDASTARQDSLTVLLNHNSLSNLWDLLKENLRLTFLQSPAVQPRAPTQHQSQTQTTLLSPLLTVAYMSPSQKRPNSRSPSPATETGTDTATDASAEADEDTPTPTQQGHGYIPQGTQSFVFDPQSLYPYLAHGISWWRGRRPAQGIPVSQAWKCRTCDFKETCSWRREKFEQHMQRIQDRKGAE